MSIEGQKLYPGGEATASQVLELADEYRRAAEILLTTGRRGKPLSWAPYRLAAIQATELYLNALMLSRGLSPSKIRALQHNMAARALFARTSGISLKKGTIAHLIDLSVKREYLISRYGADVSMAGSQLNRLAATVRDVGEKVSKTIKKEAVTK